MKFKMAFDNTLFIEVRRVDPGLFGLHLHAFGVGCLIVGWFELHDD